MTDGRIRRADLKLLRAARARRLFSRGDELEHLTAPAILRIDIPRDFKAGAQARDRMRADEHAEHADDRAAIVNDTRDAMLEHALDDRPRARGIFPAARRSTLIRGEKLQPERDQGVGIGTRRGSDGSGHARITIRVSTKSGG